MECNVNTTAIEDGSKVEQRLIALIRTRPNGVSDKDISEMSDLKPEQRAKIINKLLSHGHIELLNRAGSLFYRFKDSTKLTTEEKLISINEEKIIYQIIKEAGNKGIWIGDIRRETNLTPVQLRKILKSLETKRLTKVVKSMTNKRNMYMLYHLEPDESICNTLWYNNNEIETEFIDILSQQCYKFLEQKKETRKICNAGPIPARNAMFVSSEDICKFISDSGISKVPLSAKNIEAVLNTLIYDGKIERIFSGEKKLYRIIQPLMNLPGVMGNPCSLCPKTVRTECYDGGTYSPIICQYLKEWLE